MSFTRILVHSVWTTKNRQNTILTSIRKELIDHFIDYSKTKEIYVLKINAWENHCHALISLGRNQNIADVMRMIKGESAHWLNKTATLSFKFQWQDDYYAVSVSESHLNAVCRYIKDQEEHHKKLSWEEELQQFLAKYPKY